jgi:hypothetical protein
MQTTFFFNKIINYHYNKSLEDDDDEDDDDEDDDDDEEDDDDEYLVPNFVFLFTDNPLEYDYLTKKERVDKMKELNKDIIILYGNTRQERIKSVLMQYIHTCNPIIINPIFEIRLKYLKYRELKKSEYIFFYDAQQNYQTLYRFINRIKIKKMRAFDNDRDLCMVPFSSIPSKNIIWLFENGIKFQFNVRDLLNIAVSALSTSWFMFENVKMPKNPFTNKELTVFQLQLIYIRLCELNIKIPIIFELFFKSKFSINLFKNNNKKFLAELAIETHYNKDVIITKDRLVDILEMLYDFCNPFMAIKIHKEFPFKTIYRVFRPYLILRSKWLAFRCVESRDKLQNGLKFFNLYNPFFGYKYISNDGKVGFDDRYITYNDLCECDFYGTGNISLFETVIQNKSKYGSIACINIPPIENVQYILMAIHAFLPSVNVPSGNIPSGNAPSGNAPSGNLNATENAANSDEDDTEDDEYTEDEEDIYTDSDENEDEYDP